MKIRIAVSILLILLLSAVTAVGVWVVKDVDETPPVQPEPVPVPVEAAAVVAADFVHRIDALGTISAVREGPVSAEISGRIARIYPNSDIGSVVRAGDLLAQVDARDFEISVRKAEARVASAKAKVTKAAVDIQRQRKLVQLNREQLRLARSEHRRLAQLLEKELVSSQEAERQELAWRRIEEELEFARSGQRETEALHAIAKADLELARVASAKAKVTKAAVDIQRQRKLVQLNREQLRLARSEHRRLAQLLEKELVSSQEAERQELAWRRIEEELEFARSGQRETEALHAIAKADLELARVQREQAQETLKDTEIRAPFAGVITRKSVTLGERITPGHVLFRLADIETVKLEVRIPAEDIHRLDARVVAKVRVRGLGEEFAGRVTNIGPRADLETRSFPVEIFVANPPGRKLLPGMFASAAIPVGEYPDAVLIPRESVIFEDGEPTVFVADPRRNLAARRGVTISRRFGPRYMIAAGLRPGELLVTAGQRLLVDGARIRIVTRRRLST